MKAANCMPGCEEVVELSPRSTGIKRYSERRNKPKSVTNAHRALRKDHATTFHMNAQHITFQEVATSTRETKLAPTTERAFGLVIAFLLPGFLVLWGCSLSSTYLQNWILTSGASNAPTVGGFLYVTLASLSVGILLSAFRWATIEQALYSVGGVKRSRASEEKLSNPGTLTAYQDKIDNYYRYYQCYAHSSLAILSAYLFNQFTACRNQSLIFLALVLLTVGLLLAKARDELISFSVIREELLR